MQEFLEQIEMREAAGRDLAVRLRTQIAELTALRRVFTSEFLRGHLTAVLDPFRVQQTTGTPAVMTGRAAVVCHTSTSAMTHSLISRHWRIASWWKGWIRYCSTVAMSSMSPSTRKS